MSTQEEQNIINELDAQFGTEVAAIPARTSEQLPKQKCILKCENAFIGRSSQSGRKQMTMATVIVESDVGDEFVGKVYSKNWGLETPDNWAWLKKDMKALELPEPTAPKDLVTLTQQLVGLCFVASLVDNKDPAYPPNCFINAGARRHDLEGAATSAAEAKAESSNI